MNWSAKITEKSELSQSNTLTYSFIIISDDKEYVTKTVEGTPDAIQQIITQTVTEFGAAWELAQDLPQVGEVLQIITNE